MRGMMRGDWSKCELYLNLMPKNVMKGMEGGLTNLAESYRDMLIEAIEKQELSHLQLNKRYREWKSRMGFDSRILISTKKYIDSIEIEEGDEKEKFIRVAAGVGIAEGSKGEDGVDLESLATFLEFGTKRGLPARAHWEPVFRRLWDKTSPTIKKALLLSLK